MWRSPVWRHDRSARAIVKQCLFWMVANILIASQFPQIDNAAHLGGTIGGIIIAATWERGRKYGVRAQNIIVGLCIALVAISGITVYIRDRTDPYLFMSVEQRYDIAVKAINAGRCEKAQNAIHRARQMDPANNHLRAHAEQIDRECAKP